MPAIKKILVIGAGIAGPAICYWLRRFGFSPVLIERSANLRKGGHALDIRGIAIDLVKRMGIYGKICTMRTQEQQKILRDTFQDFGWEASKILELMADSNDFYFDSVTQVKMKSWTKGQVALLGDAGYCASPLSGQGSNLALIGAYILAGELKQADGNYAHAFNRYNKLLHPFIEANQKLGAWVSESFLVSDDISKEVAEERSNKIMQEVEIVSNMISLPEYE